MTKKSVSETFSKQMNSHSGKKINLRFLYIYSFVFSIIGFCLSSFQSSAQDAEALFKKTCGGCHSIGNGKLIGPDLIGVTKKRENVWLMKFIKNSAQFISSGDANAVAIAKEFNNAIMPPAPISDTEISKILNFIDSKGGGSGKKPVDYLKKATKENVEQGYLLFTGKIKFKSGGTLCISCHNVEGISSGGFLAKELTYSYNTIKGEGIHAILQSPSFPAMAHAYQHNPLEEDEIFNIASFLRSVATSKMPAELKEKPISIKYYIMGLTGFIILIALFFGGWYYRKKTSVNDKIFKRQNQTDK